MAKIIGIEKVNYTQKNTGRLIDGYRIHTSYEKSNVNGVATDSFFVSADTFYNYFDLRLGTEIEVYYNKYGNACGCTVLERSN